MSIVDNFAPGHADEFIWCDKPRRHTFALIVNGDSMEPEFMEGDRIVVEPEEEPRHGRYVIAKNGDTATLKQLIQDGNEFFLKPLNNRYPIKPLGDATIVGVVTHKYKAFI